MVVSAILNFGKFSTLDLDDIEGRVIPRFKGCPGWGVHFWRYILDMGESQGQIRGQMSCLLVQPLDFLRIQDACIY